MEAALGDEEYLLAHYHSEALQRLNKTIRALKNIDDNLFDRKEFEQRRIDRLKKQIEAENLAYMKEYYIKELEDTEEKLKELNRIPQQEALTGNKTLLDESLKKLMDKKIKNLKLILKRADNLFLAFSYSGKVLKVVLPRVKQHVKKGLLFKSNINSFQGLGFRLNESETKLILALTGEKEDVLSRLKLILSKIAFEIFYCREFDNDSYIQFTDKAR